MKAPFIFVPIVDCWFIEIYLFDWGIWRFKERTIDINLNSISIVLISFFYWTSFLIFKCLFNFLRNLNLRYFFKLFDELLFLIILLHNFIIVHLFIFKISKRFFWIEKLFFGWNWRVFLRRCLFVILVVISWWRSFIEFRIIDGKIRCISEKVVHLLFMINILSSSRRTNCAS